MPPPDGNQDSSVEAKIAICACRISVERSKTGSAGSCRRKEEMAKHDYDFEIAHSSPANRQAQLKEFETNR